MVSGRNASPLPLLRSVPAADDDTSLAAALAAREPQAATIACARLSPLVLGLLLRYFGPGADRQDLCQEVFLRFFARIDELRDQSALRSFLIGITLGVAQNEVRRAKVRRWIFLTQTGDLPDAPIAACDAEAREATVRFYRILASVGAEDRTLFVTRYVEKMELSYIDDSLARPLSPTNRLRARTTSRISARMSSDPALADYVRALTAKEGAGARP